MIIDVYPNKSQYFVGQEVKIVVESETKNVINIDVYHLEEKVFSIPFVVEEGSSELLLGKFDIGGYEVRCSDKLTAFDVLENSSSAPRYGFVSHFTSLDFDKGISQMNKLHLTLIQFYDWMYRHHELVPRERFFIDPMKRKVDSEIIEKKIEAVQRYNMKAIAYGAMYGAEEEYYNDDRDDLMMFNDDKEIIFIDIIGMMDISSNTKWRKHIINEFSKTISDMNFDGIHIDQYGFPKYAKSYRNNYIDLAKEIPTFIDDTIDATKDIKDEVIIDFNYVNNWPIDTISKSKQDFSYIEVWDPNDKYNDLARIITEAKLHSGNRPVVIAAYIHSFQDEIEMTNKEMSALLVMATVYSQGAYPLLFGEENGILSDPYYVNYSKYNDEFFKVARQYQDFIVKYKELLFADYRDITYTFANGINEEVVVKQYNTSSDFKENTIALKLYEKDKVKMIHMINLLDQDNNIWNVGKSKSRLVKNITVNYLVYGNVEAIYFASPDCNDGTLVELDFDYVKHEQGKAITFNIPTLNVWSMVYIKMK